VGVPAESSNGHQRHRTSIWLLPGCPLLNLQRCTPPPALCPSCVAACPLASLPGLSAVPSHLPTWPTCLRLQLWLPNLEVVSMDSVDFLAGTLAPLERLTKLRRLELSGVVQLPRIEQLSRLTALEALHVHDKLTSLSGEDSAILLGALPDLTRLTHLALSRHVFAVADGPGLVAPPTAACWTHPAAPLCLDRSCAGQRSSASRTLAGWPAAPRGPLLPAARQLATAVCCPTAEPPGRHTCVRSAGCGSHQPFGLGCGPPRSVAPDPAF